MSEVLEDESISNDKYDEKLKFMVLGETRVGKTSLIRKYIKNQFGDNYLTTVGIDFQEKLIQVNDKLILLQLWDTAGQERFRDIAKNYIKSADGVLLVYDITCKETFEKLDYWHKTLKEHASEHIKYIIVGNKCDLNEKREVEKELGEHFAKKNNINFYETSAKNGINVNEVFQILAKEVYKVIKKYGRPNNKSTSIVLKKNTKDKKKNCC